MPTIERILESPYTALCVAIVIGALALSGKFNVTATQALLVVAWGIGIIGLRGASLPIIFGCGAIWAGCLVLLGYWFTPDAIPSYAGILQPKTTLLFSPSNLAQSTTPKLQFGTSDLIAGLEEIGRPSPVGSLLMPGLSDRQFKIEATDGKVKVSTQITDENGNLIAEIIRNEWKVVPHPSAWDRNYTDDALEVKDSKGDIVLQIKVLPDRIQIQGAWWIDMGPPNGIVRLFIRGNPKDGAQVVVVPRQSKNPPPIIEPMFKYPSDQHLGEVAD